MNAIFTQIAKDNSQPHNPAGENFAEQIDFFGAQPVSEQVDAVADFILKNRPLALDAFFKKVLDTSLNILDVNDKDLLTVYLKYRDDLTNGHGKSKADKVIQGHVAANRVHSSCEYALITGNVNILSQLIQRPKSIQSLKLSA
ncbi:MAG: hypothetical protein COB76_04260 [Alphaproteobacteria bacterium]|nr:MAG: hypothetical protein COB76_04260 [Alphaproteobacteria bacterium]